MARHKIKKRGGGSRGHAVGHHDFKKRFKKKKSVLKNKVFWYLFLAVAMLLASVYFLFFSNVFKIKTIEVSVAGQLQDKAGQISSLVENKAKDKNYFFLNQGKIKEELLADYPAIEEIVFKKKLPSGLSVILTSREPVAVYCQEEEPAQSCWLIDKAGMAFESLAVNKITEQSDLPLILDSAFVGNLPEMVVEPAILEQILLIEKSLKKEINLEVVSFLIKSSGNLTVNTQEKWQIYFALNSDINLALTKLKALLEKEITFETRKNLQYVDLRFTKTYYK